MQLNKGDEFLKKYEFIQKILAEYRQKLNKRKNLLTQKLKTQEVFLLIYHFSIV
jgi:hypothetical protein